MRIIFNASSTASLDRVAERLAMRERLARRAVSALHFLPYSSRLSEEAKVSHIIRKRAACFPDVYDHLLCWLGIEHGRSLPFGNGNG